MKDVNITYQFFRQFTFDYNSRLWVKTVHTAAYAALGAGIRNPYFCGTPTPRSNFNLRLQDVVCDILIVYFMMNGEKI